MKTLNVTIERDDTDEVAGWISETDRFLLTTVGVSEQEVLNNLRDLLADYIVHEGVEYDEWRDVDVSQIIFEISYYEQDPTD